MRQCSPTRLWSTLALLIPCSALAQSSTDLKIGPRVVQFGLQRIDTEIGTFSVPERYAQPRGRKITLAFIRYKATTTNPGTPILYLAGGPGTSGIDYVTSQRFEPYLALREFGDVIALDQRGTGHSEPNLVCPTAFDYAIEREATVDLLTKSYEAFATSCASYWKNKKVDLSAYNTQESAQAVKMLAGAFGTKRFRLFGASYGSHLGIAIVRYHPEVVERAVLGGIEGPDQTIKFPANADAQLSAVSKLIASDPDAGKVLPDFRSTVVALLNQLTARPVEVAVGSESSPAGKNKLRLSAVDVQFLVSSLLGSRSDIASIPRIFGPVAYADYSAIASIVAHSLRKTEISAMGAVMDCASGSSVNRWKMIQSQRSTSVLGTMMDFPLPEWCDAWGVEQLPDRFRSPLQTSVTVLFIAGTLDGQTPVSNAVEVRKGFRKGVLFTVQNAGHDSSLFRSSPKLIESLNRFFGTGEAVDSVFQAPAISFELPGGNNVETPTPRR
jgi:pimeloyl-ACP methyl ester carboxylesterase